MRRLSLQARISLLILAPLVLATIVITVAQTASGRLGFVYFTVHHLQATDHYPVVRTILAERVTERSGLQPGDVLLRAGARSLQGKGPIRFYAAILQTAPEDRPVQIEFERDGVRMRTRLDVSSMNASTPYKGIAVGVAFFAVGTLILLRAPLDRKSLPLYILFNSYALNQMWFPGGPTVLTYAWIGVFHLSGAIIMPMFVVTALLWVDRGLPRWILVLPWLLAIDGVCRIDSLHEVWWPAEPSLIIFLVLDIVGIALALGIGIANYRFKMDALERRKFRWIAYGLAVGLIPALAISSVVAIQPELIWIRPLVQISVLAIPLGFFMAIVRYDFMDIDRLIGATASVGLIGFTLLAGMLVLIPGVAEYVGRTTGVDPSTAQTFLSIASAAFIVPAHRVLHPTIERFFFRERHALQNEIDALLQEIAACSGPGLLTRIVGEQLDALLHPDVCAIYAPSGNILTPVFNRGRAVPPALKGDGSLVRVMTERRSAIGARELRTDLGFGPADRAVVDALGAEVLLPVMLGRTLQYLICLGTKRSGDIYTGTDLALLGRVADTIATDLLRFDDAEIIRQGREMQESLRRYVPGAIADRLGAGESLESGERDVSVLFVDIQGYTSLSQGLEPSEIFSTVSRYTETVSSIVRSHGGSIVEFNGDGMMAVFGAPTELPFKEKSAVEAGQEIVVNVGELEPAAPVEGTQKLSCRVGIATGQAFVGNIQAVDRYIWSAIGNTTNLAARLEALTRTVDASIVIDATTYEAAGNVALNFAKKEAVPIRGRSEPQDLYLLPLTA